MNTITINPRQCRKCGRPLADEPDYGRCDICRQGEARHARNHAALVEAARAALEQLDMRSVSATDMRAAAQLKAALAALAAEE
jgi:hypothetical protein